MIEISATSDGGRGAMDVRGCLEEQIMDIAKRAEKLFEENLR